MRQSASDYWRFTPKAIELLLKRFDVYEVKFDGDPAFPEGVYPPTQKTTASGRG